MLANNLMASASVVHYQFRNARAAIMIDPRTFLRSRSLSQKIHKSMCGLYGTCIILRSSNNNTAGMQVVKQSMTFTKAFRRKQNMVIAQSIAQLLSVSNGNS